MSLESGIDLGAGIGPGKRIDLGEGIGWWVEKDPEREVDFVHLVGLEGEIGPGKQSLLGS